MQQILKEEVKREIREQKEVDKQISLILEHAKTIKATAPPDNKLMKKFGEEHSLMRACLIVL